MDEIILKSYKTQSFKKKWIFFFFFLTTGDYYWEVLSGNCKTDEKGKRNFKITWSKWWWWYTAWLQLKRNYINIAFLKNKNNSGQLEFDNGQSSCELTKAGTGLDIIGKGTCISVPGGSWEEWIYVVLSPRIWTGTWKFRFLDTIRWWWSTATRLWFIL